MEPGKTYRIFGKFGQTPWVSKGMTHTAQVFVPKSNMFLCLESFQKTCYDHGYTQTAKVLTSEGETCWLRTWSEQDNFTFEEQ